MLLLVLATPIAWWLSRRRAWWKEVVAAITTLPIILPPSVLGFYTADRHWARKAR